MTLDLPYWFKQRQARIEDLGEGRWKINGPNLPDAVIGVRMTDQLVWQAYLRQSAEGPEVALSEATLPNARDAVAAAFELYRQHAVN
jgi:hypothetical protein